MSRVFFLELLHRYMKANMAVQCKTYQTAGGDWHWFTSLLSPQCGTNRELPMENQSSHHSPGLGVEGTNHWCIRRFKTQQRT